MDCQRVKPLLPGYLYKDLEEGEREIVQAHLAECTDCQDDILSLRKTKEVLECWPDEEVSARMVFVDTREPWYRRVKLPVAALSNLRLRPVRAVSFGLAGVFLLLALGNTRISYREGDFSLDLRLVPRALTASDDRSAIYALIQEREKQQLEVMNSLIRESEARQLGEFDQQLKQVVLAVDGWRQRDLVQVGQELNRIRLETGSSLARTNKFMEDLIVLTGSEAQGTPRRISR